VHKIEQSPVTVGARFELGAARFAVVGVELSVRRGRVDFQVTALDDRTKRAYSVGTIINSPWGWCEVVRPLNASAKHRLLDKGSLL